MNPVRLIASTKPVRRMSSGIGASWHSILRSPLGHAGSAFGGTPPVLPRYEELWNSIENAASWYRLRMIRAEFEWRQFEPEPAHYTWHSEEMKILLRILRWAETEGSDVILQNMFMGGSWNVFDEFRGDPVLETYSAAADIDAFAKGWVALLQYLVLEKKFSCLRWICLINEPGKWWWHTPETVDAWPAGFSSQTEHLARAAEKVRRALDAAGFEHIGIMGPDFSDLMNYQRVADEPWFSRFQDLDFHCYNAILDRDVGRVGASWNYAVSEAGARLRRYREATEAAGKGLYLTEFGTMVHGYGYDSENPAKRESVLKDAALLLEAVDSGVDGVSKWSFCNRGDVDGKWQLINTWDVIEKRWLPSAGYVQPAASILGPIMRSIPRRAWVYALEKVGGDQLKALLLGDPECPDRLILFVLNLGLEPIAVQLPEVNFRWKTIEGGGCPPINNDNSLFLAPDELAILATDQ